MASRSVLSGIVADIASALGHEEAAHFSVVGRGSIRSAFAVTDFATSTIAAAGLEVAGLVERVHGSRPEVIIDRRLSTLWFNWTLQPHGWSLPACWDSIAGDYATKDGWVRLHTNAAHHRAAAERVLNGNDRVTLTDIIADWGSEQLESSIINERGCAAQMRSLEDWTEHPQGQAVAKEPLIHMDFAEGLGRRPLVGKLGRPLDGLKVLDCTRVLAGPACTRFLAGFGAQVLRIDPAWWEEPRCTEEMTVGKRCAALDLTQEDDRITFEQLLAQADVFVHGYRADALERLGLGFDRRRSLNPCLIDIGLNAYGWTGPWQHRRGFDSLVQMSSGIAHCGMMWAGAAKPVPLPVQALDHATGYLAAAAAIRGVTERYVSGRILHASLSLARTAKLLVDHPPAEDPDFFDAVADDDFFAELESTAWGPAQRLRPCLTISDCPMRWDLPAGPLRSSSAQFVDPSCL